MIRLIDIDGDGLQDIVFGAAATADLANIESLDMNADLRKFCKASGMQRLNLLLFLNDIFYASILNKNFHASLQCVWLRLLRST